MNTPPSEDPFYAAVHDLPAPGEVVRVRDVDLTLPTASRVRQVVYGSLATGDRPIAVSGTAIVPTMPWRGLGPRPVVSYGVGVHGLGRDSAPGHLLRSGREAEQPLIDRALARGWAVAVTDGEGLGMPGPHTYGAGDPGGHAMLDVVRAAAAVVPGIAADAPVVLWGYSEGGRCAAWAAETQPFYAPNVRLVAVAAGGVPADLRVLAESLDEGPYSGLALAVLVGLAHAYRDRALWAILNERGRAAAARAVDLDAVRLVLEHPEPLSDLTVRSEPWDDPAWAAVLRCERLGERAPGVPVLLYHAVSDEVIARGVARALYDAYRRLGVAVLWRDVGSTSHLGGAYDAAADVLAWLDQQLTLDGGAAPKADNAWPARRPG